MVCLATPPGARRPPPRGVSRARCAGGPRARARHRDAERGRPAYAGRQPPGARAARVAGAVLVSRRPPPVSGRPSPRARGGYGVRAAALRAVRLTGTARRGVVRSEEHTSELQSQSNLVCRLLLEKKRKGGKYVTIEHEDPFVKIAALIGGVEY